MSRSVLVPLATIIFLVGLLWGVWVLESKPDRVESRLGEEFSVKVPETEAAGYGDVLIRCTEDHLVEPTEAFVKWLGLRGVPLELPGGTWAIASVSSLPNNENLQSVQRVTAELLKRYSPSRVVVVAHDMCVFYDTQAAWTNSRSDVRERQMADVRTTLNMLRQWLPKAQVLGYYAQHQKDKLVFSPLQEPRGR